MRARFSRGFCTSKPSKPLSDDERIRLADQAKMSQNLWDFMVPERNMGVTHPFFLVLLALTLSLHYYNKSSDQKEDERLRQKRLSRKKDGRDS